MRDLPNLDLLRSVAVVLVVIDHACLAQHILRLGSWEFGYLGVAGVFMFFVHTSLVLMWSLERRPHILDFYVRRAFRIYPLAMLAVLLTVLFHIPVSENASFNFNFVYQTSSLTQLLSHLLLVQNFTTGNFIVAVMWSLPLEVQMYILLPVLFFFLRSNFSLWPLLLFWGLVVAVCLSLFHGGEVRNLIAVVPCFLPGLMAYVGYAHRTPRIPAWVFPLFLAALVVFYMQSPTISRGWILSLALGLFLPSFRQIRMSWLIRATQEIAKYSYGIYLCHPFLLALSFYYLRGHSLALQLGLFFLTLPIVSYAAFHLVEHPLIRIGSRIATYVEQRYQQRELAQIRTAPDYQRPAESSNLNAA